MTIARSVCDVKFDVFLGGDWFMFVDMHLMTARAAELDRYESANLDDKDYDELTPNQRAEVLYEIIYPIHSIIRPLFPFQMY